MIKNKRVVKFLCLLIAVLMMVPLFACAPRHVDIPRQEEEDKREEEGLYYDANGRINLAHDNSFSNGFMAGAPGDPVWKDLIYPSAGIEGKLELSVLGSDPIWTVSQHASAYSLADEKRGYNIPKTYKATDDFLKGTEDEDNLYIHYQFSTPGSSVIVVPERKKVSLLVKGSNEYSYDDNKDGILDGINLRPRSHTGEPWVHLLLESVLNNPIDNMIVNIKDLEALDFEVDMRMDIHDDVRMDRGLSASRDPLAAQLQMYFMIYSSHPTNSGQYFWLGLSMFDSRTSFSGPLAPSDGHTELPGHNDIMYDGGTSSWMYGTGSEFVLKESSAFKMNHTYEIRCNIYDKIADALAQVKKKEATWEDVDMEHLYIGDFNLGWELTGIIDAQVSFEDFRVYATYKDDYDPENGSPYAASKHKKDKAPTNVGE